MSDPAAPPARPMKFPYTWSARIAQFPLKFYINNNWIFKYYGFAVLLCVPIFYKIQKLSNSPDNVAKWAQIRKHHPQEH